MEGPRVMTREQASNAIDELAESGYAGPVAVYLNSVGKAFFGTVAVNDDGSWFWTAAGCLSGANR
jgi:hypothetical protein